MTKHDFMQLVVKECERRSFKTYRFSKKSQSKFKRWFFYKMRRKFNCSKIKCTEEWNSFLKAFNIENYDDI